MCHIPLQRLAPTSSQLNYQMLAKNQQAVHQNQQAVHGKRQWEVLAFVDRWKIQALQSWKLVDQWHQCGAIIWIMFRKSYMSSTHRICVKFQQLVNVLGKFEKEKNELQFPKSVFVLNCIYCRCAAVHVISWSTFTAHEIPVDFDENGLGLSTNA